MKINFIEAKTPLNRKSNWFVSDQTKMIVKAYSECKGWSENEIVDTFLKNLLHDEEFITFIKLKRRNKRLSSIVEMLAAKGATDNDQDEKVI
ncbi:MAG: hypothetical protein K0R18_1703 [Bacillales bacterium]|jgi:hypothetical protein|nr:hypothetical protein [Bacillales bacterium]